MIVGLWAMVLNATFNNISAMWLYREQWVSYTSTKAKEPPYIFFSNLFMLLFDTNFVNIEQY